jgi:hypothetical protein
MSNSDYSRDLLKKSRRAQQACENCRLRKQRCDGRNPCNTCEDFGGLCIYAPVQPPKYVQMGTTTKNRAEPSRKFMQLEIITSQLQQLFEEGCNTGVLLHQVLAQIRNVEKRICDFEAITRSNCRSRTNSESADPGRKPGQMLSTLACRLYGKRSPLIGFVLVLENLEDYSAFNYSQETKKDWLGLTYSEDRLYLHEPDCVANEPVAVSRQRNDLQVVSREIFAMLYEMPGYSALQIRQVEEVVELATRHIHLLQEWKHYLPPLLRWKDEDVPSLDIHVGNLCKEYLKQCSMALFPYLYVAKDFKILSQTVEKAELGDSQRKLIEIASECIHSAFQCAKLSARIYPPRGVSCRGCQDSIDYAIYE